MPSPPNTRPIKPAKETISKAPRKKTSSARISAACEACKKRKTKCTGGPPPCQLCETLGTDCVIDLSLDMRRRAAFQRTLDESRTYQDALNNLLDGIREGPSPRLEAMLQRIRGGASNQEITNALHQYSNRTEDEEGDDAMASQIDGAEALMDAGKSPADTSSLGSGASESAKGRAPDGAMPLGNLLTSLKNASPQEGEAILRQFLALRSDDRVGLPLWASEARNLWEGMDAGIALPSVTERAMWHPVLHLRSQSNHVEERPHFAPVPRRFSEGDPKTEPAETIASDSPSPLADLSRQSSRYPRITTDLPMRELTVASSPATPYFELVTNFPSAQPRLNEWDLCVSQEDQFTRLRVPRHLVLPLVIPDDSPMSRTYTDYVHGARRMLESGVPVSDVLGASEKVAVDLFFRPRQATDKFDCASWACEVSRSFDNDVFVRLASAYLLTHMMRWLLVPTLQNYHRLPDMMKPTPAQCMVPHIGAIETIPL
ncbi:Fungal Zn2-Cys6 binuclear cluster domain-containing protein isoform 2 [Cladophialophora immunda]|nr:Fungal Zn2-Cys6 binuclear cluster domain-containing protein isoform 2 [Cladophialophora immunda]